MYVRRDTLDRSRQRGTSLPNNRNTRSCPRPYARPDEVANGTRNESAALRSRRLPHVPSPKRPLGRLRAASRHLARLRETPRSARPYAPSLSRVAFLSLAPSNLLSSLICFLRTRRVRTMKKFSRNFFRRLRHFFFYNNSIQFFLRIPGLFRLSPQLHRIALSHRAEGEKSRDIFSLQRASK